MSKSITALGILKEKPRPTRREIADGNNLYLVVEPTGRKSFALRYRTGGKSVKLHLGPFDPTNRKPEDKKVGDALLLAEARVLAGKLNLERDAGRDVAAARKSDKAAAIRKAADEAEGSYPALVRRYVAERLEPQTRRWRSTARRLGFAYPKDGGDPTVIPHGLASGDWWAAKAVREITPDDVLDVVEKTVRVGVPGLAPRRERHGRAEPLGRAVHAALSAFFTFARKKRKIDANPCRNAPPPDASKARERVLSSDELVRVWRGCDELPLPYASLIRLLILTGARVREIARMEWGELSDDGATWTLPAARSKNRKALVLPLPPTAREILAATPRIDGSPYVLTFTGRVPIDGYSGLKHRLDKASGVSGWVLHDIRRSVVTHLVEDLDIRPDHVENIVNHVSGHRSGVAGVYNKSVNKDAKARALEAWDAHLRALVAGEKPPTNVVEMRRA
jgi:integrase